jgi:hypothetical protein
MDEIFGFAFEYYSLKIHDLLDIKKRKKIINSLFKEGNKW